MEIRTTAKIVMQDKLEKSRFRNLKIQNVIFDESNRFNQVEKKWVSVESIYNRIDMIYDRMCTHEETMQDFADLLAELNRELGINED